MKVDIEFECTDKYGETTKTNVFAVMEIRRNDYRLVYVEDLSGDGNITKSSMLLSPEGMRVTREGELTSDFMYGSNMVHNTSYCTPYGKLPVTVETRHYEFAVEGASDKGAVLPHDFKIFVNVIYSLTVSGDEPMDMNMHLTVTAHKA